MSVVLKRAVLPALLSPIGMDFDPTVELKGQRYLFGARSLTPYGIWPSPDPFAEKYYNISPYSYCAGDPINRVDKDGRDIFEFNSKGALINIIKDLRYDLVRITTASGRIQERVFDYGTIRGIEKINFAGAPQSYYFKVNGVENSDNIYMMLATNTSSEWSLISYQDKETGEIVNYVGTSLMAGKESTGAHIMLTVMNPETDILIRSIHSHTYYSIPSGCPESNDNKRGDIPTAKLVQEQYPYFDSFEQLNVTTLKIDRYNKDSHKSDFEDNHKIY